MEEVNRAGESATRLINTYKSGNKKMKAKPFSKNKNNMEVKHAPKVQKLLDEAINRCSISFS